MNYDDFKWDDLKYPSSYMVSLFNYVKEHPFKKGLEVGFDQGASALAFLRACPEGKLLSIDIAECAVANERLDGSDVTDRFEFKQADSRLYLREAFWREHARSFDFIYIDGDHLYDAVKQDLLNAVNVLSDDGYMIVDDANPNHSHFGVGRAVNEFCTNHGYYKEPLEGSPSEAVVLRRLKI